jgi:hypothetical protein
MTTTISYPDEYIRKKMAYLLASGAAGRRHGRIRGVSCVRTPPGWRSQPAGRARKRSLIAALSLSVNAKCCSMSSYGKGMVTQSVSPYRYSSVRSLCVSISVDLKFVLGCLRCIAAGLPVKHRTNMKNLSYKGFRKRRKILHKICNCFGIYGLS